MAFETEVLWETCELWNSYGALNWNAGKPVSPNAATAFETEIPRETDGHLNTATAFENEIPGSSRQLLGWTLPDTVNKVKCSWWWAKTSPEASVLVELELELEMSSNSTKTPSGSHLSE